MSETLSRKLIRSVSSLHRRVTEWVVNCLGRSVDANRRFVKAKTAGFRNGGKLALPFVENSELLTNN